MKLQAQKGVEKSHKQELNFLNHFFLSPNLIGVEPQPGCHKILLRVSRNISS